MRHPFTVRMIVIAAVAASLVALVPPPAGAQHHPDIYCSESGDLCQSTRRVDGKRKLGLLLAARYFPTFDLCVLNPDGFRYCMPFRVRDHGDGTFGRDVRWRRHFPSAGPGAYTVSWWVGDDRMGRILGFHVR